MTAIYGPLVYDEKGKRPILGNEILNDRSWWKKQNSDCWAEHEPTRLEMTTLRRGRTRNGLICVLASHDVCYGFMRNKDINHISVEMPVTMYLFGPCLRPVGEHRDQR